jgi:3-hydroxyisobutyrate dehydrogenase-like beta-hydroxyacid dehydrogenase
MEIGFLGLGAMGRGMAANLIKAGHSVTVWNRSEGPARALGEQGAKVAKTPAEACRGEAVFSMFSDDAAVRSVLFDAGALQAMAKGCVHVNSATVSVALARELTKAHAERGVGYVAAPVFGRPEVAAAGKLNVVVAGAKDAVEKVRPLLEAVGQKLWPLGEEPDRANAAKIAGNFMLASAIESMAEAAALVRAHGVEAQAFLELMTQTLFASPALQGYAKLIATERFEPAGFPLRLGFKDVSLALQAGDAARVPLPIAGELRDAFLEALAAGHGELDWSALAKIAARRAGLS